MTMPLELTLLAAPVGSWDRAGLVEKAGELASPSSRRSNRLFTR
jgi:hypothetical protein